jgi:hypothetical protein
MVTLMNDQENDYQQEYESTSNDPGISFLESYYQRKYETIANKDIIDALSYAAENLKNEKGYLSFIRNLLNGELVYQIDKDQRKSIFLKAAQQDIVDII